MGWFLGTLDLSSLATAVTTAGGDAPGQFQVLLVAVAAVIVIPIAVMKLVARKSIGFIR